ncbi:MAG: Cof-type HAD-IIB family hydrolase [Atopobiaceae bacterium]
MALQAAPANPNLRVALVDVDGTLVDYHNRLPESAREAVNAARANGCLVYACTGRSKAEMRPVLNAVQLDGMIGANGGYMEDRGEVIFHKGIPAQLERRVADWLTKRGLPFYLESNNGMFASPDFRTGARDALRAYALGHGNAHANELETDEIIPGMIFGAPLYRDDVNKISFVLHRYQDHLDSAAAFPELTAGTWGGRGEQALFGDLGVRGIDKAFSTRLLLEHVGAQPNNCYAFGDAKVDIPLFQACGHSCCMGSGGPEAKAAAEFVTTDVEKDGLLNAFRHFQLV